jgi:ABC-type antimicrobial peptide transport system permease subunit
LHLTAAGLVVGIGGTLALLPFLKRTSTLFIPDPLTLAAIVTLLVAIALLACVVPALRVARVNPAVALRQE